MLRLPRGLAVAAWGALALLLLAVASVWTWGAREAAPPDVAPQTDQGAPWLQKPLAAQPGAAEGVMVRDSSQPAASLPVDVDVQRLDPVRWQAAGLHPLLNADLLRIFEQLSGRGLSEAACRQMLAARIPAEYLAQAQALFERYQRYRDALATLQPPSAPETQRAESLAQVLAARSALQQKHFAAAEIDGLFADDNRYDAFTVERLRTEDRTDLSLAEKQASVARLASQMLTQEQQTMRQEAGLPARIAAQNLLLEQGNASVAERQSARTTSFGAAAAARMAEVDRQQAAWQQRIAKLAQASPEEQQHLRETEFTATERLRLEGALGLYRKQQSGATATAAH